MEFLLNPIKHSKPNCVFYVESSCIIFWNPWILSEPLSGKMTVPAGSLMFYFPWKENVGRWYPLYLCWCLLIWRISENQGPVIAYISSVVSVLTAKFRWTNQWFLYINKKPQTSCNWRLISYHCRLWQCAEQWRHRLAFISHLVTSRHILTFQMLKSNQTENLSYNHSTGTESERRRL